MRGIFDVWTSSFVPVRRVLGEILVETVAIAVKKARRRSKKHIIEHEV